MSAPIESYALIGDRRTAALVCRDGSIDWLCLPRFDSDACFAALLGDERNGRWLIGPEDPDTTTTTRRYLDSGLVLETVHETATGRVAILDVMPAGDRRADVVRRVVGLEGTVRLRHEWVVRFGYGEIVPWVHRERDAASGEEVLVAVAGPDKLVLRGPRLPRARRAHKPAAEDGHQQHRHDAVLEVGADEVLDFDLSWVPSYLPAPPALDVDAAIERHLREASTWLEVCDYSGPYAEQVRRSVLVLRAMTHSETGGIVAAPTTSLPEDVGGIRNWDYRYTWLRDAALTVEALLAVGLPDRCNPWRNWLLRAVAGDPADLQIMYTVDGGRRLPERELVYLAGYEGSRPVRVGNGAVEQRQGDVLGEVLVALQQLREAGVAETEDSWNLQRALVDDLCRTWRTPDHGLWEIRGPARRFTHSMVMAWAAFDRAVRAVREHGMSDPDGCLPRWERSRDAVREDVLRYCFNERMGCFTQHDATTEVDAALLVMPLVGFVEADDPRFVATVERIEHDLMRDGLLLRYRTQSGVDGLSGDEHPFLICSFWLVSVYALMGRREQAHALMRRLLGLCNDVGLLSEEYDVDARRQLGNFPQAFSHLGLVQAAVALAVSDAKAEAEGHTEADA